MVRKTDQRTFASIRNGEEPKLETITRETIETFHGQRTECKITTEKKDYEDQLPLDLVEILNQQNRKTPRRSCRNQNNAMAFETACLEAHNTYRKKHGVPPLKLNTEMCRLSQKWANTLIKRNTLEHSNNPDYGENIYCISSNNPNFSIKGDDPVKSWYDEIKVHEFGVEPPSLASGHFTQVVWKETRELGVALSKLNGKIIVVANYLPPGNIIGHFSKNVPPIGGFSESDSKAADKVSTSFSGLRLSSGQKPSFSGAEGNFETDFLKAHNDFRHKHGVPPLKLDKKLCKYSEEWARICASKNCLEHRKNSPYGENIYCTYSSDPNFTVTGSAPVNAWYDEISQHVFGREPKDLKSGHFTQVVWKTSEMLGVGVAKSRQGHIYVVANYSPAGNFVGSFSENVPPLHSPSTSVKQEPPKASQVASFDEFEKDALKVHNEYRRKHGVSELVLNKKMCAFAKEWAETCAKTGHMAHRPNNSYGENIFGMFSSDFSHTPSAREAVKKWYDEIKDHTFGTDFVNTNTLHFTQVVWKGSGELGIGLAKNSKGQSYVVANYSPRGNIVGQFTANVPKPRI